MPSRHLLLYGVALAVASLHRSSLAQVAAPVPPAQLLEEKPLTYPAIANRARVQGVVVVQAAVDVKGAVADARVLRSVPLLDTAALDAIRQWRFAPPEGGRPVVVVVTVTFSLNHPPSSFTSPQPSWMPLNFAFIYTYVCKRADGEIDSVARLVRGRFGSQRPEVPFELTGQEAATVYLKLVEIGFFESPDHPTQTWRELARVPTTAQPTADGFSLVVVAKPPVLDNYNLQRSGKGPHPHRLAVRVGQVWRTWSWSEPIAGRFAEERGIASAGRMIRQIAARSMKPPTTPDTAVRQDALCL